MFFYNRKHRRAKLISDNKLKQNWYANFSHHRDIQRTENQPIDILDLAMRVKVCSNKGKIKVRL